MSYYDWAPYVSVAERRQKAARAMEKLRKQGHPVVPVIIEGRSIARTFWGKAWCDNLQHYSDYSNRLPRGRTYVRNGSVLDLQFSAGLVEAMVSGSHIYQVQVKVKPVPGPQWQALCKDCGGAIASLVELLQGRFSKGVMERICRQGEGLFPRLDDIHLACSCPDGAYMCKHVAAVLYGIGARLDDQPELLFLLRGVNGNELLAQATSCLAMSTHAPMAGRGLDVDDLSELFGLEMGAAPEVPAETVKKRGRPATPKAAVASIKAQATQKPKAAKSKAAVTPTKAAASKKPKAKKASAAKPVGSKAVKPKTLKPKAVKAKATKVPAAKPAAAKGSAKAKSKAKSRGGSIG